MKKKTTAREGQRWLCGVEGGRRDEGCQRQRITTFVLCLHFALNTEVVGTSPNFGDTRTPTSSKQFYLQESKIFL